MFASSRRATDRAGRRRQAGQSVVEFALAIPVLLTLLFGVLNIGVLITDKVVAAFATRQGARVAAELGNAAGSGLTLQQVDQNIEQTVLASAANLGFATITEVDIYQADATGAPANGSFNPATDPYDSYVAPFAPNGTSVNQTFSLNKRNQVPPGETSIGVRLLWTYTPPTGYQSFSLQLSDYTVMKATAVLS
jgi:Flp pilus assembly protein TadG